MADTAAERLGYTALDLAAFTASVTFRIFRCAPGNLTGLLSRHFLLRRNAGGLFPGFFVGRAVNGLVRSFLELLVRRRQIFATGIEKSKGEDERDSYPGHLFQIVRRIDVLQRC